MSATNYRICPNFLSLAFIGEVYQIVEITRFPRSRKIIHSGTERMVLLRWPTSDNLCPNQLAKLVRYMYKSVRSCHTAGMQIEMYVMNGQSAALD